MTYAEKIIELGKENNLTIIVNPSEVLHGGTCLTINGKAPMEDCLNGYFDIPDLECCCSCKCDECWNSEYQDEKFLGFPDIKSGNHEEQECLK